MSDTRQFLIRCTYDPAALGRRDEVMPDHLRYFRERAGVIRFAGPVVGDDGSGPLGNRLLVDIDDRAAAEVFIRAEPFNREGMVSDVEIVPCRARTSARQVELSVDAGLLLFACEASRPFAGDDAEALGDRLLLRADLLGDDGVATGEFRIVAAADRAAAETLVPDGPAWTLTRWRFGAALAAS